MPLFFLFWGIRNNSNMIFAFIVFLVIGIILCVKFAKWIADKLNENIKFVVKDHAGDI